MTVPGEAAAANYVPAAAVIRRQQALFGVTGRKGCVGGSLFWCEISRLNWEGAPNTEGLEYGRGKWNSWLAVKCVDIRRNTGGVDGFLDRN